MTLPIMEERVVIMDRIQKELDVLDHAFANGNIVEVATAIGGLLSVIHTSAATCGLDSDRILAELRRSPGAPDLSFCKTQPPPDDGDE